MEQPRAKAGVVFCFVAPFSVMAEAKMAILKNSRIV